MKIWKIKGERKDELKNKKNNNKPENKIFIHSYVIIITKTAKFFFIKEYSLFIYILAIKNFVMGTPSAWILLKESF